MPPGFPILLLASASLAMGLEPVSRFPLLPSPIAISRVAEPAKPYTVAGERGLLVGHQNGSAETWIFPNKIFDGLQLTAELSGYPVPIDVNTQAAWIDVNPGRTTITYSHAAFTIRQHMFVPRSAAPVIFFEIDSIRPLTLTVRFTPRMERMWPASNFGRPSAEWVAREKSGFYILHTDNPQFSGAVALPRAKPGILAPYQERPKTWPVEFILEFDPRRDQSLFYPLLVATGSSNEELERSLESQNAALGAAYQTNSDYWTHFFDTRLTADTPDEKFNHALRWAEISIDQSRVRFHDETGMVAGYYSSGDSARPGFGWFFGRDTLWTLYAVSSYGDLSFTRTALEFLIKRQRDDGKIMHEHSQTADLVDWKSTPYFYASADSTPLFIMAMEDYLNISGDLDSIRRHWRSLSQAYKFMRAHDSDGDGIYENTEGTGWVEGWPPKMPHQEIYLAALDAQASASMARLAKRLGEAKPVAGPAMSAVDRAYYDPSTHFYAFSRNPDRTLDKTATVFPSVAWWDGTASLSNAGPMLDRWASPEFSTGWGTRDVSSREPLYDPISYHQGSVWPLYTGWVSLAEFRAGRAASGYRHLMQNADLTYAQDLGAVTELLSGEFFQPFGRSSSHQTWSSAMVLSPALRGLFGLGWDASHNRLNVDPHLPAAWDHATLHNVPLGQARLDLDYRRTGKSIVVRASSDVELCHAGKCAMRELAIPIDSEEPSAPHSLPTPGSK